MLLVGALVVLSQLRRRQRDGQDQKKRNCCSLTRGPPHSTTPLKLADVQRIDRNLGGFCQNLERTLSIHARILATKCNCVCKFPFQGILKKTCKNGSRISKIHQNCPKWRPSKKDSPKDRKRAETGASDVNFLDPLGIQNQPKSKKRGLENRCFFRPPPGTDFASF